MNFLYESCRFALRAIGCWLLAIDCWRFILRAKGQKLKGKAAFVCNKKVIFLALIKKIVYLQWRLCRETGIAFFYLT
jgi:hypothetical protein